MASVAELDARVLGDTEIPMEASPELTGGGLLATNQVKPLYGISVSYSSRDLKTNNRMQVTNLARLPTKFMCEFCHRDETRIAELKEKIRSRPCNKGKESKRQRDWYEDNRDRKIQSVLTRYRGNQPAKV